MKKRSPIATIILLFMSVGILGSIFYVSNLLNGKNQAPVTQIKKTKASAQTYHKLLALNDIPITPIDNGEGITPTPTDEPEISPTIAPTVAASPFPTITKTLQPTIPLPTAIPTMVVSTTATPPTLVPTKQSLLLAYHNPSPTITQGTPTQEKTEVTSKPSQIPTKTQALPETGWVQTPLILFIVASSTILLSLLF